MLNVFPLCGGDNLYVFASRPAAARFELMTLYYVSSHGSKRTRIDLRDIGWAALVPDDIAVRALDVMVPATAQATGE